MTRLRIAAACVIALASSLLLARVHPFGDAGLYKATPAPANIMQHSNVPPRVRDLLIAKCADCHSTETRAPLYGRLAPISWLLERDILEGRKHMNLSAWDTYSPDEQQTLQAKILTQTRTRKMPLPQYRNIHRGSAITTADLALFTLRQHIALRIADLELDRWQRPANRLGEVDQLLAVVQGGERGALRLPVADSNAQARTGKHLARPFDQGG